MILTLFKLTAIGHLLMLRYTLELYGDIALQKQAVLLDADENITFHLIGINAYVQSAFLLIFVTNRYLLDTDLKLILCLVCVSCSTGG